jgi:hypothetical protein
MRIFKTHVYFMHLLAYNTYQKPLNAQRLPFGGQDFLPAADDAVKGQGVYGRGKKTEEFH